MWYKGYTHYHTSFKFPSKYRVSPKKLIDGMHKLGASFAFCAGDHGNAEAGEHGETIEGDKKYWGIELAYNTYPAYRDYCLENSASDILLIGAPEVHIRFAPFPRYSPQYPYRQPRHEHHSCVPGLKDFSQIWKADRWYSGNANDFITNAHKYNLSVTLNHPYLSVISAFSGPEPLTIPAFRQFDYFELFTADWPNFFPYDFETYLKFLQDPSSAMMGCCASVDNACRPHMLPKDEPGIVNSNYFYIPGELTSDGLLEAWNQKRGYSVHGYLYLKKINPIPSTTFIRGVKRPRIEFTVANSANKRTTKVEIYNKGIKVYEDQGRPQSEYTFSWEDKKECKGETHYIIHIEAGDDHLVTCPINYLFG